MLAYFSQAWILIAAYIKTKKRHIDQFQLFYWKVYGYVDMCTRNEV